MNIISTSPNRYLQRSGRGRHDAVDYARISRKDPFRSGQIAYYPRLGFHLNTIGRMISRPCPATAGFRNMY